MLGGWPTPYTSESWIWIVRRVQYTVSRRAQPITATSMRNKPDGTVKDSLRMARGYWEAKDSHDDYRGRWTRR